MNLSGVKQSFGLMRAHITINAGVITKHSIEPSPPNGGAQIKRDNQSFFISFLANPSA